MSINWEKIEKNYPAAWDLLNSYFLTDSGETARNKIRQGICFCDIVKFFDDNKIIIDIIYDLENNNFWYTINKDQFNLFDSLQDIEEHYSRQEAKEQSTYKAFQILEEDI